MPTPMLAHAGAFVERKHLMAEYPVEPLSHAEPAPTRKTYINAQSLLEDSFRLGMQILESGFRPSFIVGIWRGGTPVGIAVQELLDCSAI